MSNNRLELLSVDLWKQLLGADDATKRQVAVQMAETATQNGGTHPQDAQRIRAELAQRGTREHAVPTVA